MIIKHAALTDATGIDVLHERQVIVDGTFCQAVLQCKISLRDQLPSYLGCKVNLMYVKEEEGKRRRRKRKKRMRKGKGKEEEEGGGRV